MPSNHLILLPSIFPSIRVFSNESVLCIRWPKYWSCSFNISPSNEHLGLISFKTKGSPLVPYSPSDSQESSSIPQFKSINSSVLCFLYSPTLTSIHDYWKNHSLDQTDLCEQSNVSAFFFFWSLLFNMLSRLVITFFPRSKHLLISWLKALTKEGEGGSFAWWET